MNSIWKESRNFNIPCFPSPSTNEGLCVLAPGLNQNTKPIPPLEGPISVGYRSILQQLKDGFPMAIIDQERERENQRLEYTINMDGEWGIRWHQPEQRWQFWRI